MKSVNYQNIKSIVIGVRKNLYMRTWERADVEIRFVENKKLEIDQTESTITISGNTHCMISAPASTDILVEQVGGNCKIFGNFANMTIERVDGNLQIESIENGLIERVGGNFYLGVVTKGLSVERVGGNLNLASAIVPVQIEKVGGNLFVSGSLRSLECSVGGNINLFIEQVAGTKLTLRAGENIHIGYKGNLDVNISAKGGGTYNLQMGDSVTKGLLGSINKSFGDGSASWSLSAGANINILPVEKAPFSSVSFESMDDAHWEEIAMKIQTQNDLNFDFSGFNENFSEKIRIKTNEIETRVQKAMEKIKQSGFSDINENGFNVEELGKNAVQSEAARASQPVSNEERLLILQMLQDKKITAEEADRLLNALEQF